MRRATLWVWRAVRRALGGGGPRRPAGVWLVWRGPTPWGPGRECLVFDLGRRRTALLLTRRRPGRWPMSVN
jgi:hypothetical protein